MSKANGHSRGFLSRESILGHSLRTEELEIPEWSGSVRVRELTAAERDQIEQALVSAKGTAPEFRPQGLARMRARVAVFATLDEDGKQLFTEGDIDTLAKQSAAAIQRIFEAVNRLSAMQSGELEAMVGNSAGGQTSDSPIV